MVHGPSKPLSVRSSTLHALQNTSGREHISASYGENGEALVKSIFLAIDANPSLEPLMVDIASHVAKLREEASGDGSLMEESQSKKRKLDDGKTEPTRGSAQANLGGEWKSSIQFLEISFTIPQRKKMTLEIGTLKKQGVRAVNAATKAMESGVQYSQIEQVLCLPVPEKAAPAHNFVVIPQFGSGIEPADQQASSIDPLLWSVAEPKPKEIEAGEVPQRVKILDAFANQKIQVLLPDANEFASAVPQPHRKGEKAFHVKAFRGSKDGYLFFLPAGLFYGFKKPLLFFSFASILSTSYSSILQRTFNLTIKTRHGAPNSTSPNDDLIHEFEFAMLDQADFQGIDQYVKNHGLDDESMAEGRRAEKFRVNGRKGEEDGEEIGEGEEGGELERAEREAQAQAQEGLAPGDSGDEEDDENFDPGSEGESEGSGTGSEEEDGDGEIGGEGGMEAGEDEDEGDL